MKKILNWNLLKLKRNKMNWFDFIFKRERERLGAREGRDGRRERKEIGKREEREEKERREKVEE